MKKFMKVLCLALVLVMVIAPVASFATSTNFGAVTSAGSAILGNQINQVGGSIYKTIQIAGYAIAVCMIAYMGIQWLLATPSKKAELKGRMFSVAIGIAILLVGVSILGKFAESVSNISL